MPGHRPMSRTPRQKTTGAWLHRCARWLGLAIAWGAAAEALGASVSLDKGPIVLGRTESVGVTFTLDEAPGTEDRPLRLSVNVGSFASITRTAPGKYRSVYVPPTTRFTQVALVAVWRETGPDARIDFLRLPLYGMGKLPVPAKPRAEVRVQLGLDTFGPVVADAKGKAEVPVIVPPGVVEATGQVKDKSGATANPKIPISVPIYNRLTAALVPHAVLADGQAWARVEVFYDLGGADLPADRVKLKASLGSATFQAAQRGRYAYRYVPPAGATEKEVRFSISVDGDSAASASAVLSLALPPPARVLVRPPEKPLAADGHSRAPVGVTAFDAAGLGLPGQTVKVTANGEPLAGVTYRSDGVYVVPFVAPAVYPPGGLIQFAATVTGTGGQSASATANYQLQAAPLPKALSARLAPDPVPADGRTRALLRLDVRDDAGLPLKGASLILVASHGTLGKLEEVGDGRYQATYVGPAEPPEGDTIVRVVDSTGAFEKTVPVPLRSNPHRLLFGVRGGVTHDLGDLLGARVGPDLWLPVRIGSSYFGVGLSATWGTADQPVKTPDETRTSVSHADFFPIALRLGYEIHAGRRLSLSVGGGGVATFARFRTALLPGKEWNQWGFGGFGFGSAGLALGPGQAFVDLIYSFAPVATPDKLFNLQSGGASAEAGYRIGLF